VNLRADAIKPNDAVLTLRQRFVALHARVDKLQPAQSTIEPQTLIAMTATEQTTEVINDDDGDEVFSQGLERSKSVSVNRRPSSHQDVQPVCIM
jgi:t-SNARE complex subunit (syntaxin)